MNLRHICVWHSSITVSVPIQLSPLFCEHSLVLVLTPPPHETEHSESDQLDHPEISPLDSPLDSLSIKYKVTRENIFSIKCWP